MAWRLARSLGQLREQIDEAYPNRNRRSDGTIGDAAHASRTSDHNPWVRDGNIGVVTAMDITHDPSGGIDCNSLVASLIASRDPRIKYVIFNRRMWRSYRSSRGTQAWQPEFYTGSNPHSSHMHISVVSEKRWYDSTAPWRVPLPRTERPSRDSDRTSDREIFDMLPELSEGDRGRHVSILQGILVGWGYKIDVDGIFGEMTRRAVVQSQRACDVDDDGIVGPITWRCLLRVPQ